MIFAPLLLGGLLFAQTASTSKIQASGTKPKPATARQAPGRASTSAAPETTATTATMTDEQKTIYALGLSIAQSIAQFDLSPAELKLVEQALSDSAVNKPAVELSTWGPKIQGLAQARVQRLAERTRAESEASLPKAAAEPGATTTPSGLIFREIKAGTGPSPTPADTVRVNYRGTFVNGKEFDSSYSRNEPAQFELNKVIPCWTEGLQKMKVGGKATLVCPAQIAYGEQGRPGIPGGAALVFEIELLAVNGATQ